MWRSAMRLWKVRFWPLFFGIPVSAYRASYFLLLRQKKVAKEKAQCLWLAAGLLPAAGLAPAAGLTFLCFAKEKISKRKASQRPCPCGLPCATRAARGRAQTRYAQTSARPDPVAAALLSTANGRGGRVCSFAALTLHTLFGALRARARARAQPQPRPLVLAVPLAHPRQPFSP